MIKKKGICLLICTMMLYALLSNTIPAYADDTCNRAGKNIISEVISDEFLAQDIYRIIHKEELYDANYILKTEDFNSIKEIVQGEHGYNSLEGLQCFLNLENIRFSGGGFSNVNALYNLTNLKSISIIDNFNLNDINGLANKPILENVNISRTSVSDISSLGGNTELSILSANETKIVDLNPLSGLINLTQLDLNNNEIQDITPISDLPKLNRVELNGNKIYSLAAFSTGKTPMLLMVEDQVVELNPVHFSTDILLDFTIGDFDGYEVNISNISNNGIKDSSNLTWTNLENNIQKLEFSFALNNKSNPNIMYDGTVIQPLIQKSLVDVTISPMDVEFYRGVNETPHTPKPVLTDGDYTLVEGLDYDLYYSDNVNAGQAKIAITGIGTYDGTVTVEFQIVPSVISQVLIDFKDKVYDGSTSGVNKEITMLGWIQSDPENEVVLAYDGPQWKYPSANVGWQDMSSMLNMEKFYLEGSSLTENYMFYLKNLRVNYPLISPATPVLATPPKTQSVESGTRLSDIGIIGGIVDGVQNEWVNELNLKGTFKWVNANQIISESGFYEVMFIPDGYDEDLNITKSNYIPITFSAQVLIHEPESEKKDSDKPVVNPKEDNDNMLDNSNQNIVLPSTGTDSTSSTLKVTIGSSISVLGLLLILCSKKNENKE